MKDWQKQIMVDIEDTWKWKLVRKHDGLTKYSEDIKWIEWNDDGTFKQSHSNIDEGLSLLMSPFNDFFTWQTTTVTEVLENTDNLIIFKTENSTYELSKL